MKKLCVKLLAMLVGMSLVEIPCWGVESVALQDMLGVHFDRVMRKSGLIFPTRNGEPFTNWFGRVVMEGDDALPFGYNYIQLRDSDGWAEVRDEDGVLTREVAPLHADAAFVLGDLFGFVPSEDTPPELRLSHLVSKWLVCHSEEESDAVDLTEDELRWIASARARRIPRLASAPLVVTNLMVTAISAESDRVTFVTEWPSSMSFPNNRLDLYTSVDLRGAWSLHGSYDVAGVNAITTTVMKTSIAGFLEGQRAQHDDDCYVITNIVASAFEPGVTYTNRHWNCEHRARAETPGFFRWADRSDSDGDGLTNAAERWVHGTNPDNSDTDGDGLDDRYELSQGINPIERDSDGDGLDDGIEVYLGTSPSEGDSDNDGISDIQELDIGLNPSSFDSIAMDDLLEDPPPDGGIHFSVIGTPEVVISPVGRSAADGQLDIPVSTGVNGVTINVPDRNTPKFDLQIVDGLYFIPSISGIFEFRIDTDDDGELSVGPVTVEDHYRGPEGEARQGLFREGVAYPIKVHLYNDGSKARFSCPVFGRLVKVCKERFESEFGSDVVVFEDEYLDESGRKIPKNSTTFASHLVVTAGAEGGVLTLSGNYDTHLKVVCGSDKQPGSYYVGPYETISCHAVYQGNRASGSLDDVTRIVSWEPFFGEGELATTNRLTVVEVKVEATANFPQNKHRHVFGSYENIKVTTSPCFENASITCAESSGYGNVTTRVPGQSGTFEISINHNLFSYALQLSVVEPQSIHATSCEYASSGEWLERTDTVPDEPWVAGIASLQMLPLYVSFENLALVEGYASPAGQTGVFRLATLLDHIGYPVQIVEASIYYENEIEDGDLFGISGFRVQEGFEPGGYYYSIPQYWCLKNEASLRRVNPIDNSNIIQSYQLSADNILTVSKHGYSVEMEVTPFPRDSNNEN